MTGADWYPRNTNLANLYNFFERSKKKSRYVVNGEISWRNDFSWEGDSTKSEAPLPTTYLSFTVKYIPVQQTHINTNNNSNLPCHRIR